MIFGRDLHHSVAHFMLIVMKCKICKRDFEAVRPDARYCGTNCRSTAYRARLQTLAQAGLRAQPSSEGGANAQQTDTDDDPAERLPFEPVPSVHPGRQTAKGIPNEHTEFGAEWSSPAPSPARPTTPPPRSDQSAEVRALADAIVEQQLGPLQQAIEELIQKTQSQKADHKAALKKERKKRKQLRKNLESQWWAGGGHIPGWLVPALAAGGGGLLVNLLTATEGKKIGTWLADILFSTPQTSNSGGEAQASQPTVAQLLQELFATPVKEQSNAKGKAKADRTKPSNSRVDESGKPFSHESAQSADTGPSAPTKEAGEQSASSLKQTASEPSEDGSFHPEACAPWTLPREVAADLLAELTGAQRLPKGFFYSEKMDRDFPLVARLVASVEPSLAWQRKRANIWSYAWRLFRAAMSLLQLVNRIESAANAQLPFKDKPVTATALALMEAARELQERIRSHLCGIQNHGTATSESLRELVGAATRIERAVKRARPAPDDLLACALHDALVDLQRLVQSTHYDEQLELLLRNGMAFIENCALVQNRHDFDARCAEITVLHHTDWAMERYGPKQASKADTPPETPKATADATGQLAWDSWLNPTDQTDTTEKPSQEKADQSSSVESTNSEQRQVSREGEEEDGVVDENEVDDSDGDGGEKEGVDERAGTDDDDELDSGDEPDSVDDAEDWDAGEDGSSDDPDED